MSVPSSVTRPETEQPGASSFMRLSVLSSVDLPQPEGPMRAQTSFSGNDRLTSLRTWVRP